MRFLLLSAALAIVEAAKQAGFQLPPTEVIVLTDAGTMSGAMNLAADDGTCIFWDRLLKFDLSSLSKSNGYKNEKTGILFNFCKPFTIT